MFNLSTFIKESWSIEDMVYYGDVDVYTAHNDLLEEKALYVGDIVQFVQRISNGELRNWFGLDVAIGDKKLYGNPDVRDELVTLLEDINKRLLSPYQAHIRYELMHPFTDGNGRSGRAIWLWHMKHIGKDPYRMSFLEAFYRQAIRNASQKE